MNNSINKIKYVIKLSMLIALTITTLSTGAIAAGWGPITGSAVAGDNWNHIGNWRISWDISYDAVSKRTTYRYWVYDLPKPETVLSRYDKDLSHWNFSFETCVTPQKVLSYSPAAGYEFLTAPNAGNYQGYWGIKWDTDATTVSQSKSIPGQVYTLVLDGDVAPTDGVVQVKAATTEEDVVIKVPGCKSNSVNEYKVEGNAFIDINGNGVLDRDVNGNPIEPIIADVNITLNGATNAITTKTNQDGAYMFSPVAEGSYTLSTQPGIDYNADGLADINASTAYSVTLAVNNNSKVDFGYSMSLCILCNQVTGEGRTIGFWKHQLNTILTGKGSAQINKQDMSGLMLKVQSFWLADPFIIINADGTPNYAAASAVLSYNGPNPLALMLKQLLAAEFNYMYEGLTMQPKAFVKLVLMTAESSAKMTSDKTTLLLIKDYLDYMNNLGH